MYLVCISLFIILKNAGIKSNNQTKNKDIVAVRVNAFDPWQVKISLT